MLHRARTLCDLRSDEALIDLTDATIVLQFADCVRNLSVARRRSIWTQNVHMHESVHYQTIMQKQMDDILLFLIIIYSKEAYPEDDDQLIDKLRGFITSSPFKRLKKYIHQTYFPLHQDEFVNNANYFAAMIEDYAERILHSRYNRADSGISKESTSLSTSKSTAVDSEHYSRLEDKMMDLFTTKFGELESKINNLEKDLYAIKYSLQNGDKEKETAPNVTTDRIMEEIDEIKKVMNQFKIKPTASTDADIDTDLYSAYESKTETDRQFTATTTVDVLNDLKKPKRRSKKLKIRRAASSGPERKRKHHKKKGSHKKVKKKHGPKTARYIKEDSDKRKEVFRGWLADECEMSEYFDVFIENGIDNLAIIQHVTITDLALLGIGDNGHKVKIMQCIQKLKYEQATQDPTDPHHNVQ